jgi:shikimate kinase
MEVRRPIYESIANIIIDVNGKSQKRIVEEALGALK